MRTISKIFSLLFILMLLGCDDDVLMPTSVDGQDAMSSSKNQDKVDSYKATGDVEVTFISNPGGNENGNENISKEGTQKFANVVFNAHEGDLKKEAKGNIEITMKNKEGIIKRTFVADVYEVKVNPLTKEARFLAMVISDIRTDEDESGHEDSEEEHTGQGSMNGGGNGGNHTDGDHTEGDESHDDSDHGDSDHGGGCGSDDEDHGKQSRVGQTLGVKVCDGLSPGTNGDKIGWKWYAGNNPNTPSLENNGEWAEMCLKDILAGNLVVHLN
jgi:hypothetical protein